MKKKLYEDFDVREQHIEKSDKVLKNLKESWKHIQQEAVAGYPPAVRAGGSIDGVGAKLHSQQGTKPFREQEELDDEAPIADPDIAPEDPAMEPPPEPISVDEPEVIGDSQEEQANIKTGEFVSKALSNLPSDAVLEPTGGAYMGDVQDEHLGAFTIVVYPKEMFSSLHDLASALQPQDDIGGDVPAGEPALDMPLDEPAPEEPSPEEPSPEEPSDVSPLDVPEEDEPAPVEEPIEDDELSEEVDVDEFEDDEQALYESREPASVGKKDWKKLLESRRSR